MLILTVSRIIGVSSFVWVRIWIILETNTLALCFLVAKDSTKQKNKKISTMTYFLTQMLASSLIIFFIISPYFIERKETLLILLLILKIGAWPSHKWYLLTLIRMNLRKKSSLLVITWQKIIPAILISILSLSDKTTIVFRTMILASLVIPLLKTAVFLENKKTISLSSLRNNGWILIASIASLVLRFIFITGYRLVLWFTIKQIIEKEEKKSIKLDYSAKIIIILSNIRGIPPMTLFWVKLLVLINFVSIEVNAVMPTTILILSCVICYLYVNMLLNHIIKPYTKHQINRKLNCSKRIKNHAITTTATAFILISYICVYRLNLIGIYFDRINITSLIENSVKHVNLWS